MDNTYRQFDKYNDDTPTDWESDNSFGPAGIYRPLYIVPNISDGSDFISGSMSPLTSYQRDWINNIITICNKNVEDQKSCVDSLLKICCRLYELTGGDVFVSEITLICNKILSQTCKKSLSIIGVCQAFTGSFPSKQKNIKENHESKKSAEGASAEISSSIHIPSMSINGATIPAPSMSKNGTSPAPGTSINGTIPAPGTFKNGTIPAPGTSIDGTIPAPGSSIDVTIPAPSTSIIVQANNSEVLKDEDVTGKEEAVPEKENKEQVGEIDVCDTDSSDYDLPVVQIPPAPPSTASSSSSHSDKSMNDVTSGTEDQEKLDKQQKQMHTGTNIKERETRNQQLPDSTLIRMSVKRKRKPPKRIQEQLEAKTYLQDRMEKDVVKGKRIPCGKRLYNHERDPDWSLSEENGEHFSDIEECVNKTTKNKKDNQKKIKLKLKGKKPKNKDMSKSLTCTFCKFQCVSNTVLEKHQKKHICQVCGKILYSLTSMSTHMTVHTEPTLRPFVCEKCGSSYRHNNHLKSHILQRHTDIRPYPCDQCNSKFVTHSQYKLHKRLVHEKIKKFQCDQCGACFSLRRQLKDHSRHHTGERPFRCDVCLKSFSTNKNLYVHKRIHDSSYKFTCEVCGKGTNQFGNMKSHMRTHTGEKPYICTKCGKGFAHNVTQKQHFKICGTGILN